MSTEQEALLEVTSTLTISKVLIANRGEIAVRVIRAAKDAGIASVAVYAEPDTDSPFVELADEAFALGGNTAADSYLSFDKIIEAAKASGADAIHPGYGFLSENADFAQRVIDEGLTWIGPSPDAIARLGDKVEARRIAEKVSAPMAPGTKEPVNSADEVVAFAEEHGLPVAIKAAYGGGGRGMKVAHTMDEIPELFDSATREAVTSFGRGECFVERYLDRARHVEAQVLADAHGHAIVAGTRDCTLQRRFQKLVEEAPAPFLTDAQREAIHSSAKAIVKEAGYQGAGTVEYLVSPADEQHPEGIISFLEVNTRLQVEHPVTEETAGIDLVREQFRIASGLPLRLSTDPTPRGHAIEFRINGEDPGMNFMPAPGTITRYVEPSGTGVRVDSGVRAGNVIGGQFDSMLAKLIVTGETRAEAIQRARRALDEYVVDGLPTVIPFHQAVLKDPAFVGDENGFRVYTRWIEEEFTADIPAYQDNDEEGDEPTANRTYAVEIDGRRIEVALPASLVIGNGAKRKSKKRRSAGAALSGDAVPAPMQGTVVKVNVSEGDAVSEGDILLVLEAMKMENPVKAHKAGTVKGLAVEQGEQVNKTAVLLEIR
ncbi:acetyl/propionyl/methylcrotonyl-CoA carboxylase subunit alpha [Corynebacterium sp. P3-F1]|uniref:acetyl-CoA carboxylase biotin carboxylase subunit n=1 Tax=Corynebacterium sp. P3-F1 TaxID=3059080 RepID=UPI00265CB7D6|nr:acetyl/propionyl/methylcrotonyl-CoA carboxylase subunit alpha [Corynebacterium sp. P3-F1]WKK60962.1 acetyl/propionyl/methylcrotonyl-CoA carboxylase subunit alpha [Corynebacterium sp. P3-F1]